MKDNLIKRTYVSAFSTSYRPLKDLMIINTKCLVDDKAQRYVYIDNNRLKDELIYYNFYGEKLDLHNIINILLPVILSNTNIQRSEDECVSLIQKYVKYLKKEEKLFEFLLASVMYNIIIHTLMENKNIEYSDLLQVIKERIIGFTFEVDKLSTVKFQMARINFMQKLDRYIDLKVDDYKEEKTLESILNILYDIYVEDRFVTDKGLMSIKKSILSILGEEIKENVDNIDFINSMAEYIVKLRKYLINKKDYILKADPRSLISLNEGDTKVDPILNKVLLVSKKFNNNILRLELSSKSGTYILNFKKA